MAASSIGQGEGLRRIQSILGDDSALLEHQCKTIAKEHLHLPGPDFVDRIFAPSDRSPRVLGSLQQAVDKLDRVQCGHIFMQQPTDVLSLRNEGLHVDFIWKVDIPKSVVATEFGSGAL